MATDLHQNMFNNECEMEMGGAICPGTHTTTNATVLAPYIICNDTMNDVCIGQVCLCLFVHSSSCCSIHRFIHPSIHPSDAQMKNILYTCMYTCTCVHCTYMYTCVVILSCVLHTCTCNLQQVEINPHYIQEELSHLTEQCNTLNPNVERVS